LSEELLFFCGSHIAWNLFDIFLVSTAWSDIIIGLLGSSTGNNYNFMRTLRVLKVVRSFRIVRIMTVFQELRVVLLSLFASIVPLLWAMACVFIIMFLFSIIMMQAVTQFVTEQPGNSSAVQNAVIPYFSSVYVIFRTLLMAITGGQDWFVFHDATLEISSALCTVFIVYICLMTFGTLNIITAIMVESATSKARHDFEVCKSEQHHKMKALSRQLCRLFHELQPDMSGIITKDQWEALCDLPQVATHFDMLGIDISKGEEVWGLLDLDHTNKLNVEEFVAGCLQIQGGASNVNIEVLMQATRTLMPKLSKLCVTCTRRSSRKTRQWCH